MRRDIALAYIVRCDINRALLAAGRTPTRDDDRSTYALRVALDQSTRKDRTDHAD